MAPWLSFLKRVVAPLKRIPLSARIDGIVLKEIHNGKINVDPKMPQYLSGSAI